MHTRNRALDFPRQDKEYPRRSRCVRRKTDRPVRADDTARLSLDGHLGATEGGTLDIHCWKLEKDNTTPTLDVEGRPLDPGGVRPEGRGLATSPKSTCV